MRPPDQVVIGYEGYVPDPSHDTASWEDVEKLLANKASVRIFAESGINWPVDWSEFEPPSGYSPGRQVMCIPVVEPKPELPTDILLLIPDRKLCQREWRRKVSGACEVLDSLDAPSPSKRTMSVAWRLLKVRRLTGGAGGKRTVSWDVSQVRIPTGVWSEDQIPAPWTTLLKQPLVTTREDEYWVWSHWVSPTFNRTDYYPAPSPDVVAARRRASVGPGVYFAQETGTRMMKIGHCGSAGPLKRLRELSTGNPRELHLTGFIKTPSEVVANAVERVAHRIFRGLNVRSEWFVLGDWMYNWLVDEDYLTSMYWVNL